MYLGFSEGREEIKIKVGVLVGLFVVACYVVVPHHVFEYFFSSTKKSFAKRKNAEIRVGVLMAWELRRFKRG